MIKLIEKDVGGEPDCPFCAISAGTTSARIVFEDANVMAFFPTEPATLGHTLVIPRVHRDDIWSLEADEVEPLATATVRVAHAVRRAMNPDGLNIINSAGAAASQTVFHVHVHVLPRWEGDPVGDIWPPQEDWSAVVKDEALASVRSAWSEMQAR